LNQLLEAAVVLAPADRPTFLASVCAGEPRLRAELEALLAREQRPPRLELQDRQRISGVFHAAFALPPGDRGAFLDLSCAGRPDDRREIESLLRHAADSGVLEQPVALATASTRLEPAPGWQGGSSRGAPVEPPDPLVGRKIREHVILSKLGEGGMGVVYKALDTKLEKHVAIKMVRPEYAANADYRRRLVSEAQLAARLSHPNIATVHALFDEGPDLFIVSEYVPGSSLREIVSRGPLPYARLVEMFTGIASGLEAAHAKGIIHRDLKPDNVLLAEDEVPKIVDFGLAKSTRAILSHTRLNSRSGTHPGTPAYMAPEQIEEEPGQRLDFRCDLFAFGVTLYEAASGINPFEGRSLLTTLENIKRLEPPVLARPGTDLHALNAIVQRCLRKNPLERYASTGALVRDLEQLAAPVRPKPGRDDVVPSHPWTWWEVHQLAVGAAFYPVVLTLLWLVHALARPLWASRALAFASLVVGSLLVAMRLHYLFASRERLSTLARTRTRYRRPVSTADWVFSAVFAMMAGLMLLVDRPGTAAPLLIAAVVNVVLFLVVEPASEADAFHDDADEGGGTAQRPPPMPST
jgi:hypothetical protein